MRPSPVPTQPRTPLALAALLALAPGLAGANTAPEERHIDDSARQALAVTIYNQSLALVKDRREVVLTQGLNRLAWRDVSAQIRPQTALVHQPEGGGELRLLEQNFDFDLLTPRSLLEKYVGRTVQVIRTNDAGQRTNEEAQVLAVNDGVVLRYADRIETGIDGHLAFADLPANLRDRPTLVLSLEAEPAGQRTLELTYLTAGLSWSADYVAELDPKAGRIDLRGLVTLTNQSGIAYPQAQLQLVAGEVNVTNEQIEPVMSKRMMLDAAAAMPPVEDLTEYHLYTLPGVTDLRENQTKQVALLSAAAIPVERGLEVHGRLNGGMPSHQDQDGWSDLPVAATLSFVNRDGDLGVPLPAGTIRVYSRDRVGNAQFIGEDHIDHTPRKQPIRLTLGNSFDVTARRKQTAFTRLGSNSEESTWELEVSNAKQIPVSVRFSEWIGGDWQIVEESQPHEKTSARLATWQVEVPADGKTTLTWKVRVQR